MLKVREEYDPQFNEGLQSYVGKPFKELLKDIYGSLKIRYDIDGVDIYGSSGGSVRANQVGWYLTDFEILKIYSPEDEHYDIVLVLKGN